MDRRQNRRRIDAQTDKQNGEPKLARRRPTDRRADRDSSPATHDNSQETTLDEVVVLIPVLNDWEALAQLLPKLDSVLTAHFLLVDVLVVDDGSTVESTSELENCSFKSIRRIDVLSLRRNLGHQRAIAIGLAYVEYRLRARAVVVMDGDGEDDPADVPRLLEHLDEVGSETIVFAERTRRSESLVFRLFYSLFQCLHYILTGNGVRVGNFSVIPRQRLSSLVVVAELWNHYAAAVFRSRQPNCKIPSYRATRLSGRSQMNFVSLVTHGLSAISVHSDVVGVRLLMLSLLLATATLVGIIIAVVVRFTTDLAIPGWATSAVGLLLILLTQVVMASFVLSFAILGARHGSTFLPRRDYSLFIGDVWTIHGPGQSLAPSPMPELAVKRG
jgi:hypothetical protein